MQALLEVNFYAKFFGYSDGITNLSLLDQGEVFYEIALGHRPPARKGAINPTGSTLDPEDLGKMMAFLAPQGLGGGSAEDPDEQAL